MFNFNSIPAVNPEYWYKKSKDDLVERYIFLWLAFEARLFQRYDIENTSEGIERFLKEFSDFDLFKDTELDSPTALERRMMKNIRNDPSEQFKSARAVKKISRCESDKELQLVVCYELRNSIFHRVGVELPVEIAFDWLEHFYTIVLIHEKK